MDGSIDSPDAPIVTYDKVTYTLTGNIASALHGIIVERDNIVIDGAGHTIQGGNSGIGIDISNRYNVAIKNTNIKGFNIGVKLYNSQKNTVSGNNIANNLAYGIYLDFSSNNNISDNFFINCGLFVQFHPTYGNVVVDNTVNGRPLVYLEGASDVAVKDAGQVILVNCNNITVQNLNLSSTSVSIELLDTNNTKVIGNMITNSHIGVCLMFSSGNNVSKNYIANNRIGIDLWYSPGGNIITKNTITNNQFGVATAGYYYLSSDRIYHNNFINNTVQVRTPKHRESLFSYPNVWYDVYPGGGNYWSDYAGVDYYGGPGQDEPGCDSIGDTPYVIDENNVDRYPLMRPCAPVRATVTFSTNGLDSDASGTILTVDGASYSYTQLPVSFTWDVNSTHSFTWTDYVGAGSGKRFAWVSTSGFSTARSDTIIVPSGGGSVTATYKTQYRWALSQTGIGSDATETIVTVDGSSYGYSNLPQTFWWDSGSSHSYSYQEYVSSSTSGKRYANHNPPSWSGTISGSGSLNPSYHIEYRLTISASSSDAGSTNPAPGSYWYDPGSSVSVSATANAGYTFSYWLLDGNNAGSSNPITVTMNALHNLTAIFSRASYTLTVYVYRGGSTSGISGVTVKVDGTSYTTDSSGKVSVTVAYGSHTIEVVTPYYQISDTRYIFTQWSDGLTSNPRSISVTSNTTLTAYMKRQYKLTVNVNPSGGGSISASPSSSDWFYDGDSSVTLSVDSSTGFIIRYIFTGWSGDLASSNPTIIIVMDGPKTIIANWRTDYSKLIMFLASIIAAISLSIFYLYYARSKREKGTIVIDEGGQIIEYLKRLDELYKTGKITKEAYEALKAEYEEKLKNNKKLAHK
ncbi:MAG: NosD domain-containing protein [Candidatus Bathyarchaeia archaeon]